MSFGRPGCCPDCGTFVAVRTKHAYRCRPQSLPSQEVPWSGRSPMLAWPRSHRFRTGMQTWLRSPLPNVGPRLLVLLAQHRSHARHDLPAGKRARYGPSHALVDLFELAPEQVLDEVLRPAPAWVPCEDTWHRVLLWNGELWAMDHGEIDVESEEVAAVLAGMPLTGCSAALAAWTGRATSIRLPWLESLARFAAAASWAVDELAVRDSWIDARVTAERVREAGAHGISDVELLRWVGWERRVERVAAWREVGWTADEAHRLQGIGLTAAASAEWRAAGMDVPLILEAMAYEFAPAAAGQWWRAGFGPEAADRLLGARIDLPEARALKARLRRTEAVLAYGDSLHRPELS